MRQEAFASGGPATAGAGRSKLAALADWTPELIHLAIEQTAAELDVGMGKVGMPLRVAVTGAGQSPALGRDGARGRPGPARWRESTWPWSLLPGVNIKPVRSR